MIVDDQTAIRQLLSQYVAAMPGFTVVAEASTVDEALLLAAERRPQIVVLDWALAEGTALNFLSQGLGGENPPWVLVFSGNTSDIVLREAFSYGARGFLEKTAGFSEFVDALHTMAERRVYMSSAVMRAVHRMSSMPEPADASALTAREIEVVRCLADGMTSKAIAEKLGISVSTVGIDRASIAKRTGLSSVAHLTLYAVRRGLLNQSAIGEPSVGPAAAG